MFKVNKSLVQLLEQLGVKAVGISGKDGGMLKVDKKYADGQDIGFVGEVKAVDPKIIYDMLEKDFQKNTSVCGRTTIFTQPQTCNPTPKLF